MRYAVRHGIAELSLRPLAAELGTSSRMLIHYFGTKENLIGQALAATRPDVPVLLERSGRTPAEIASRLWRDLSTGGEQEPRVRLLLEVMALALTQPERYGPHAAAAVRAWVEPLADAMRDDGYDRADARATALVSGLRGLALDRYLTGDRQRTDEAAALLIAAASGREAATGPQLPPSADAGR